MADILPFKKPPSRTKRSEGKTLCSRGLHRWVVDKERRFDVKQGKLVTTQRCSRCGLTRTKGT